MYDRDCYELACHFLQDLTKQVSDKEREVLRADLAQRIQDTIEGAMREYEAPTEDV